MKLLCHCEDEEDADLEDRNLSSNILHPNVLELQNYFIDEELSGDTFLNLVTDLYQDTLGTVI